MLLQEDPLSTIRDNKLITQGEKLETSAKLRVFVSTAFITQHNIFIFFVEHVRRIAGV